MIRCGALGAASCLPSTRTFTYTRTHHPLTLPARLTRSWWRSCTPSMSTSRRSRSGTAWSTSASPPTCSARSCAAQVRGAARRGSPAGGLLAANAAHCMLLHAGQVLGQAAPRWRHAHTHTRTHAHMHACTRTHIPHPPTCPAPGAPAPRSIPVPDVRPGELRTRAAAAAACVAWHARHARQRSTPSHPAHAHRVTSTLNSLPPGWVTPQGMIRAMRYTSMADDIDEISPWHGAPWGDVPCAEAAATAAATAARRGGGAGSSGPA